MPSYQPLHGDEYKGIVFARFWRFGKWETIYFDDRLPTMYGRPLFAKSSDPDEFWISLLEKGYAKYVSYCTTLLTPPQVNDLVRFVSVIQLSR
jgi:hypothetical protein